MSIRATVTRHPGDEGPIVILKPFWYADNGYETCSFPTRDEAIDFAKRRWGVTLDEILIKP